MKNFFLPLIISFFLILIFNFPSFASGGDGGEEEPAPSVCGAILPIEPQEFDSDRIDYEFLKDSFSNKFPLDLVSLPPPSGNSEDDCPVFSIMDRNIPICTINALLAAIKWPLIIRYIIWSVFSL